MLTTNDRFIQAIDPNAGVARVRSCDAVSATQTVTAPAYLALATIPSAGHATAPTAPTTANVWSEFGRKAMTKVDFHDRWPLHSTS